MNLLERHPNTIHAIPAAAWIAEHRAQSLVISPLSCLAQNPFGQGIIKQLHTPRYSLHFLFIYLLIEYNDLFVIDDLNMMHDTLLRHTLHFPASFSDAVSNEVDQALNRPDGLDLEQTLVIGDAHGGILGPGNTARCAGMIDVPLTVAAKLDRIIQSTLIDDMHVAYLKWKKHDALVQRGQHYSDVKWIKKNIFIAESAKGSFEVLKSQVSAEISDFKTQLSLIVTIKTKKKIQGMGDDVGDRGGCDLYCILMGDRLNWRKVFSNHGAELLYAWVTDSWTNIDDYYEIRRSEQRQSLIRFKILLIHGLLSPAERDELLKTWAKTLDLMLYSQEENQDKTVCHTTFYMHAPGGLGRIFNLAQLYQIHFNQENIGLDGVCDLACQVMQRFKCSLEKLSSPDLELVTRAKRELYFLLRNAKGFHNSFHELMYQSSTQYLEREKSKDRMFLDKIMATEKRLTGRDITIHFIYGHIKPRKKMPKNMTGIDNDYGKPWELVNVSYLLSDSNLLWQATETEAFSNLSPETMEKDIIYYDTPPDSSDDCFVKAYLTPKAFAFPQFDKNDRFLGHKTWNQSANIPCSAQYCYTVLKMDQTTGHVSEADMRKFASEAEHVRNIFEEYLPANERPWALAAFPLVTTTQRFPQWTNGCYAFPPAVVSSFTEVAQNVINSAVSTALKKLSSFQRRSSVFPDQENVDIHKPLP